MKNNRLSVLLVLLLALVTMGISACGPDAPQHIEGYYRYGFEQSDFYPLSGGGPYWLEADGEIWDELHAHFEDAPGRGGGMTLHLTVEGDLQTGGGFGHLGEFEERLTVRNILAVEAIPEEGYQAAIAEIGSQATE